MYAHKFYLYFRLNKLQNSKIILLQIIFYKPLENQKKIISYSDIYAHKFYL